MENLFYGIFDQAQSASNISVGNFMICIGAALVCGLILALVHMYKSRYTKSFVATLALLPAVVCVVIMMVNGNIGTGIAVAGAFSLVRFRSAPGSAKEIMMIFLSMGAGLICGMGYLGFAFLFTAVMSLCCLVYSAIDLGFGRSRRLYKTLSITIPEDLDYTDVFADIFEEYTSSAELTRVKTTNMVSMFRLSYELILRDPAREKEMIDSLRTRNGNLEISISNLETESAEL